MRIISLAIAALAAITAVAQKIDFRFQDGLYDQQLRNKAESSISALLTEFNNAHRENRSLRLDNIPLSDRTRRSLTYTWDSLATFTCDFDSNVCHCLKTISGYEVREIYVTYHPRKPAEYKGPTERELSVGFLREPSGAMLITHARPTLDDDKAFRMVMSKGSEVDDVDKRLEILQFVENFRYYYDEKDIRAIEQTFSDSALIVTGRVIKPAPLDDMSARLKPRVVYNKQNKTQYINSLKGIFARNRYIRVTFDSIEIKAHPTRDNYYGVSLRQNWKAMNANKAVRYEDDGYLFLLWEFREGKSPKIHVRTWQPEWMDAARTVPLDSRSKLNLIDFEIP